MLSLGLGERCLLGCLRTSTVWGRQWLTSGGPASEGGLPPGHAPFKVSEVGTTTSFPTHLFQCQLIQKISNRLILRKVNVPAMQPQGGESRARLARRCGSKRASTPLKPAGLIPALTLTASEISGKPLKLLVPWFPHSKNGMIC